MVSYRGFDRAESTTRIVVAACAVVSSAMAVYLGVVAVTQPSIGCGFFAIVISGMAAMWIYGVGVVFAPQDRWVDQPIPRPGAMLNPEPSIQLTLLTARQRRESLR